MIFLILLFAAVIFSNSIKQVHNVLYRSFYVFLHDLVSCNRLQIKRNTDEKLSGGSLDSKASLIKPVNGAANDREEKLNYNEPMDIDCNIGEMSIDLEKNVSFEDCDVVAITSDGKANELCAKVSKQNSAVQEVCQRCSNYYTH